MTGKLALTLGSLPITEELEPTNYEDARLLVGLYHSVADKMTKDMQEEYIGHLQTRAFCKPTDNPSPMAHALCQSAITALEFTWPKWIILATLYGSDHPELAIMKKMMENDFDQDVDLNSISHKEDVDALTTCEGEAELSIDDFFDLLGDERNDLPVKSNSGSMKSRLSTPTTAHSVLSVPDKGDWLAILPRASERKKDMLQPGILNHPSVSVTIATQQPEALDALCVRSNSPLPQHPSTQGAIETMSSSDYQVLIQRIEALELRMNSDTSVLINQRMKVLETRMDSHTSTFLNQRVRTLEKRMDSESSALLEQRLKALEARLDADTSVLLDRRLKKLETKMSSGASSSLDQRVTQLETNVSSNTSALAKQRKDNQRTISNLEKDQISNQNILHSRINRHKDRLDKMNIRVDRVGGRVFRIERDYYGID